MKPRIHRNLLALALLSTFTTFYVAQPSTAYGLCDMAGNVFEWCWDCYGTPYGQPTNTNPTGPASGGYRVLRGGYWADDASVARCASRYVGGGPFSAYYGVVGFRCVRGH